jgi:putative FmdB family regulatory protein
VPTYQYACTECDEQLEVRQSFTDDALTVCPACEGRLRKVFNAVGVVFKGSGFYKTDSRQQPAAASGKEPGGKESGGSESGNKESGGKDAGGDKGSGSGKESPSGSGSSGKSGDSSGGSARSSAA